MTSLIISTSSDNDAAKGNDGAERLRLRRHIVTTVRERSSYYSEVNRTLSWKWIRILWPSSFRARILCLFVNHTGWINDNHPRPAFPGRRCASRFLQDVGISIYNRRPRYILSVHSHTELRRSHKYLPGSICCIVRQYWRFMYFFFRRRG